MDEDNRVHTLFFTYIKLRDLARANLDVVIADCTYRTNRYNMPLLHFLGTTAIDSSFSSAFAFLPSEEMEDYQWAIK
jgi:hypothetical protein